jgi:hypothetical protein
MPPTTIAHLAISTSRHRRPYPNTSPPLTDRDRLHKSKPSHSAQTETPRLWPPPVWDESHKDPTQPIQTSSDATISEEVPPSPAREPRYGKGKGKKAKRRVTPTHESADPAKSTEPGGSAEPGDSTEAVEPVTPNNRDQL